MSDSNLSHSSHRDSEHKDWNTWDSIGGKESNNKKVLMFDLKMIP